MTNPWGIPERFSPGPWEMTPCQHGGGLLIRGGGSNKHPQASLQIVPIDDARLIAAAPGLLAELVALVVRCDGAEGVRADGSNIDTSAAHAAIYKALGVERERGL